ncbi:MAG: hypothetical protein FWE67_02995 [Planctomycetaceae bacterium]|nr:hypothetical protein [Planctomycetaceae bacterium]
MVQEPVYLTDEQRLFVESEIPLLCNRGGWSYHIAGCQREHLHFLVSAKAEPKAVRRWFKTWLTQSLNEKFRKQKWLADGGSTLYVNDEQYFDTVYQYILKQRITHPIDA